MAIRIEDSAQMTVDWAGQPWTVGVTPHRMRVKLMRQHVGWTSVNGRASDLVDVLLIDSFNTQWQNIADSNSKIYDQLDGSSSPYRCRTLSEYVAGLQTFQPHFYRDPVSNSLVKGIKGFVVKWPLNFLIDEDTAPSAASKVIIPTNLWV